MVLDGILSGLEALVLALGLLFVITAAGVLVKPAPLASGTLMVLFPFALSTLPYIRCRLRDRGLRALKDQEIARCRKTIAFDARNTGAHLMLAKALEARGGYAEAVQCYETVLNLDKDNRDAKRGIEDCLNLERAEAGQSWLCHVCHAENTPQALACAGCRTPRSRPALVSDPPLQRVGVWVGLAMELAIVVLLCAGSLGPCGAVLGSLLVAGATYAVYTVGLGDR
jgi:tetratricopeptide (TPR) repeat protein